MEKPTLDSLRIDRSHHSDTEERGSRWLWVGIATVILVALAAGGIFIGRGAAAAEVTTAMATQDAVGAGPAAVLNASGYVTARRKATVSSKITGKVVEVLVEEGMRVEENQVIARLDDVTVRLQLALAEAELSSARKALTETEVRLAEAGVSLGRAEDLASKGVSSQSALDAARAERDSLQARLHVGGEQASVASRVVALARQDLEDTVVRAPFAGIVVSKDAQPGEMISPVSAGGGFTRTGIGTLVDMTSLEVEVDVNEAYIGRVLPGQKVEATLDAYPDWRIPAHVITSIPTADRQKATVKVRIGFESLDPRMLPDMGVKVAFLAAHQERDENAAEAAPTVRVPRAALREDAGQEIVLVVRAGRVERRAVTVGPSPVDPAEILAGVTAGEEVVVAGPVTLKDGDRVKIVPPSAASTSP